MRLIDADKLMLSLNDNYLANSPTGNETLEIKDYRESMCEGLEIAMATVEGAPTVNGWISVKDRMPAETHSIFFPLYGKQKWTSAMWREQSDKVLVTVVFKDGTKLVTTGETHDGVWNTSISRALEPVVTHWQAMPEPPEEEEHAPNRC